MAVVVAVVADKNRTREVLKVAGVHGHICDKCQRSMYLSLIIKRLLFL